MTQDVYEILERETERCREELDAVEQDMRNLLTSMDNAQPAMRDASRIANATRFSELMTRTERASTRLLATMQAIKEQRLGKD